MNFKESLVYNNKFYKKLDSNLSNNAQNTEDLTIDIKTITNSCPLIDYIKNKYILDNLDYNSFIEKIEEIFGSFIFYISKDEDSNYLLINKNLINNDTCHIENFTTTIYQKYPFQKICSFMTPYYLNNNAILKIKNMSQDDFAKLYIKNSIEGVDIIMLYNSGWKIITEKSLEAKDSVFRNKKIIDLFNDIIETKNINLNELNTDNIYYLTLVHHKNNGILNFNHYGSGNKDLYLNMTSTCDFSNNQIIYNLNPYTNEKKNNFKFITRQNFTSVNELIENLNHLSYENMNNKKITLEGYNLYNINDDLQIYKLQTHIYQQVINIKPKNTNINVGYLELYQENKLKEYLPFYTNYHGEIIHRISSSIRTISKEFLDIYHYLKKHKNPDFYNNITPNYKKILYKIHGIYIDSRKNDFIKNNDKTNISNDEEKADIKSITVHDIYHYLKSLTIGHLKQIYIERELMIKEKKIDNNIYNLFIKDCIYTITQTKLMILE
jgi:hypothetical protein